MIRFNAKDWYKKTISLDEGLEKVAQATRNRDDILTEFQNVEVAQDGEGKLCVKSRDGRIFYPTTHAWKQISKWHNMPTTFVEFMSTDISNSKNPELTLRRESVDFGIVRALFHRQRKTVRQDKQFLYRTYKDDTLRAMMSDRYGIIDNGWYLETIQKLFKETDNEEPRLFHWRGNEDTIYGNLLLMDTIVEKDDGEYGAMLSMSNCEIGLRSFSQRPSIFRGICSNGVIFGKESGEIVKRKHLGDIDYSFLSALVAKNITTQIPLAIEGVNRFLETQKKVVEVPMRNLFAVVAKENGFSTGEKGQLGKIVDNYVNYEMKGLGNKNLFGIINSITRTGQMYSNDEWVRFDEVAGRLMSYNDINWNNLQIRAKSLSVQELDEIYGVSV